MIRFLRSLRRSTLIIAGSATMAIGAAGIAWASIPGSDGVIHGCYKNSNPAQGALIAIDSAASCPSGTTALNWNQTGPAGPAGPQGPAGLSGVHVLTQGVAGGESGEIDCPAGEIALSAQVSNMQAIQVSAVIQNNRITGYTYLNYNQFYSGTIWVNCAISS